LQLAHFRDIEFLGGKLLFDVLVLHLAHFAIGFGNAVEGFHHLRLEFGLHGREREIVLVLVVVVVVLGAAAFLVVVSAGLGRTGLVSVRIGSCRLGHLGVRPGI